MYDYVWLYRIKDVVQQQNRTLSGFGITPKANILTCNIKYVWLVFNMYGKGCYLL